MNNRQNGRRRGRSNNNNQRQQGGRGGDSGNRIDSRARGNAAQLLEKYKNMARDAQLSGDRVMTEYYLQFADHYFRVIADVRQRQEEQRGQRESRDDRDRDMRSDVMDRDFDDDMRRDDSRSVPPSAWPGTDMAEGDSTDGDQPSISGDDRGNHRDRQDRRPDQRNDQRHEQRGEQRARRNGSSRDGGPYRDARTDDGRHNADQSDGFDAAILPPALNVDAPRGRDDDADMRDTGEEIAKPRRGRPRKTADSAEGAGAV